MRRMLDGLKGVEGLQMPKTMPPIAAWALSIGCTVGWGAFVMPISTFLPKAGPLGTAIAFLFGMLAMLAVAYNYGYMARYCPGTGGVYDYAREVFGQNHAFICSWCLVLAYCASMVSNATALALVVRGVFGDVLRVGPSYVVAGYDVYFGEVFSGIIAIVVTAFVCIRSARMTGILETMLALGLTVGIAAIFALALGSPHASPEALSPGFSPTVPPLAGMLYVVAMVPWAFIGFEAVSQVAGECDFAPSRFMRVMGVSIIIGTVMYLTLNTVAAMVIPEGYANWAEYLADLPNRTNLVGITAIPLFQTGNMLAGRAGVYLFGITAFCAVMSGVVGFYVATSRLIHTMAQDGALSSWLGRLHGSYRTPVTSVMAILVVTLAIPFLGRNVLTWIVDLMSLGALIAYLYTSLATIRYARAEQNEVARVIGVIGVAVSVLCIALLVIPIPQLGTSLSKESYVILFAWIALGVNFFTPTIVRQD